MSSTVIVCLGFTGSIIGLIQGIVWMVLSLCGILIRFEAWIPQLDDKTYQQKVGAAIIKTYVEAEPKLQLDDVIITGDALVYCFFIYVVLAAAWCVLSLWMMFVFLRKKRRFRKTVIPIWCWCTYLISLQDLVLTILLGVDYSKISSSKETSLALLLATGTMMSLAARGYVLWIVNVIVATVLMVLQNQAKDEVSEILRHHIDAYESNAAARQENDNYGFEWDYDKPSTKTQPDVYHDAVHPTNQPKPDQLAQIGKPRGRTTPTKVSSPQPPQSFLYPRVPSPDYSPVMERRNDPTKSALKTRSQNLYGTQF